MHLLTKHSSAPDSFVKKYETISLFSLIAFQAQNPFSECLPALTGEAFPLS